ncbi:MAG TPA: phosphoglycerate dehydrogenase [Candidatus Limnocylindrales bacterium]|nr:phosphoglycerate dehydrogenase [Candidatus Limnocylindrales bacterium]
MIKIVIPDDFPSVISGTPMLERLKPYGEVKVWTTRPESTEELIRRMQGAEVVINIRAYCKFTEEVFQKSPSLRLISIWGTGVDNVDLEAAQRYGVTVTNTPNTSTESVAEHALALMLAVARQIPHLHTQMKKGVWTRGFITQLFGKTAGIIGTGVIGQQTARLCRGIGMQVLAWTYHPSEEKAREIGFTYVPWETLLRQSDVISLHLRLSKTTEGLIGKKEFGLMKPSAIFINTARGAIVQKEALLEALREKKIAGAGLDVFDKEPIDPDDPLLALENVVVTPHCAPSSPEVLERGLSMAVDNVISYLGGTVKNRVV